MRKALTALLAVGVLLAGIAGMASPAGAEVVVELSASVASNPVQVSPPGALVHYTVTIANDGAVAAPARVTDTTTNGTLVAAPEGCSVSGDTATCDVTVPGLGSTDLAFVVRSPATAGTITNSATVALNLQPGQLNIVETDTTDNASSVQTTVIATGGSTAYLRPGDSLTFKTHKLTVVEAYGSGGGAVAHMDDANIGEGVDCGTKECQPTGLHLDFTEGDAGEAFHALLEGDLNFPDGDPCFGLGADQCHGLYYRTDASEAFSAVEPCPASGLPEAGHPCVQRVYKEGRTFHHVIRLYSSDPEVVETIKSIVNTNN